MLNGGRVRESPPFLQETSKTHTLTLTHTQLPSVLSILIYCVFLLCLQRRRVIKKTGRWLPGGEAEISKISKETETNIYA